MSDDIASRFARDAASHQMTVLHDDGLYRHLRFTNPDSTLYSYEVTTTPGQLVFSADGHSFVFRLVADMFEMFRRYADPSDIDATHWAESCKSRNAKSYSRGRFEGYVWKQVGQHESLYPGLREDVQEKIFDSRVFDVDYELPALMAVLDYAYWLEPDKNPTGLKEFRFKYVHEWVLADFDWWFLFALHAIKDAIVRYDARICGSRCPKHPREHYCRRSPGHQAGICRDVQQKGQESCTWDPAKQGVLR